MKKKCMNTLLHSRRVKKVLLMMKLTTILFLAGLMQVSATVYSQATKFSFKAEKKQIVELLKDLEESSNFRFFYIREQVNVERQVSIKAEDATVEEILDEIFSGQGISYKVLEDNLILLSPEKKSVGSSSVSVMQQNQVSGVVNDESGQPLPGVTVVIKGTSRGTITDGMGKYSLSNIPKEAKLLFSFVGMIGQEISVGAKAQINVTLKAETIGLEEVVAVGYGVQKKSDVTGSISSVKSEDLKNLTFTDAAHAMQGKAAGVQIVNATGAPGSTASIQIRGYSSNAVTSPLIIVDGLKVPNMNYLDPENIKSIEVLKDGASAAIYGIEAGNGVILITTKNGGGQGKVFYNFQQTSMTAANMPKMLNAQQYMDYQKTSGVSTDADFDYDGVTDTNWGDLMFETGSLQRHTVGFQGGNDRGNLYVSLNSINNDGIITGDKDSYKRLTGQINADYKIKDWLTIGITTSLEKNESKSVSEGSTTGISTIGSILVYDPITPWSYTPGQEPARVKAWLAQGYTMPTDPETGYIYGSSKFAGNSMIWHPAVMRDKTDSKSSAFNIMGTGFLNLTPIKGLTLTSRLGYRAGYTMVSNYNYAVFVNATATQKMTINGRAGNTLYYQWENFGNYLFNIGKHSMTAMAGMSYQYNSSDFVRGQADALSNAAENYRYLDYALNSTGMTVTGAPSVSTNMSYYGRLGWSYQNKYNLQASFRADAYDTSKLDKDHRWGYFPSISGGWTLSSEPFMKKIKNQIGLSVLKLRASYGVNGNVNALGTYQYNTTLAATVASGYDFGSGQVTGVRPSNRLANPGIKWETTRQLNFAFDSRFFHDRLELSVDWYNKNTNDLLTSTAAPGSTGASTVYVNAGKVNNKGLEFVLGWRDKIGGLTYSLNANFASLHNEVTVGTSKDRVSGTSVYQSYPVTYFEAGYPLWYLRTFILDHIDATTGKAVYKDFDDSKSINSLDQDYAGSAIPTYTYGLTLNLGYKNFDLTVYGSGVGGNKKLYALNRGDFPQGNTLLEFYENMWTPTNTNAKYPKPDYTDTYYRASNAMVFSAAFFKIKQIQLGYNLPKSILRKFSIGELRTYVSLDDWFTFTKYPGLDPETNSVSSTATTTQSLAIDAANYPISRKVVFGVNVSF
jgi:TonB-dependent starch-binding outer membrane protein SusC